MIRTGLHRALCSTTSNAAAKLFVSNKLITCCISSFAVNRHLRVASSVCRACLSDDVSEKLAAFIASGTVDCSISILRSCGNNSRMKPDRLSRRVGEGADEQFAKHASARGGGRPVPSAA
jgi:hypothetical protein